MKVSVLIPWRTDNGQRERILEWVLRRYALMWPDADVVLGVSGDEQFNRSAARNNAAEEAVGDVFVIADADTIVPEIDVLAWAADAVHRGLAPWIIPYAEDQYFNLSMGATESLLLMDPDVPLAMNPRFAIAWDHQLTSWAGALVLTRDAFEAVGGYDERFNGWGYEDNAFRFAMDTLVGPHQRLAGAAWHLWHPNPEEANFGQPNIKFNRKLFERYDAARDKPAYMRQVVER